jgi:hypothetical protein
MKKAIYTVLLLIAFTRIGMAQTGQQQYLVNSKTLNMRTGAAKTNEIISTLTLGDAVTLIEKTNKEWWYVDFDGLKGYVFSSFLKSDPYSSWEKKYYQTGVTPDCENVSPQYDYNIDNYLRINVGSATDVVVKLMKRAYYGEDCVRIIYVRGGEIFDIKNIPEGKYYLKIAYGKDYRQKVVENQCYVKFIRNAIYEKGSDILDFNKTQKPDQIVGSKVYKNWSVPSFELTLDVITTKGNGKTFSANNISESEFNK